jgi:hypothetical protein
MLLQDHLDHDLVLPRGTMQGVATTEYALTQREIHC